MEGTQHLCGLRAAPPRAAARLPLTVLRPRRGRYFTSIHSSQFLGSEPCEYLGSLPCEFSGSLPCEFSESSPFVDPDASRP